MSKGFLERGDFMLGIGNGPHFQLTASGRAKVEAYFHDVAGGLPALGAPGAPLSYVADSEQLYEQIEAFVCAEIDRTIGAAYRRVERAALKAFTERMRGLDRNVGRKK